MRFLGLLLWILCCGCGLISQGVQPSSARETPEIVLERGEETSIRVATWNVRNLFDSVDDPYGDDVLEGDKYPQKIRELCTVLEEVDADFVALQEVENFQCLDDLNSQLAEPYPQIGLLEGNDQQRGIDVAFLSRVAVDEVISHKATKLPRHPDVSPNYKFSRDCLEVRLRSEPPLTLLINHLKSGRGDGKVSASKRRVQAEGIAQIAERVDIPPQIRGIVILGDLNDRPDSWALAPLFEKFVDPLASIPQKERVTHRYKKGGSALDHILLDEQAHKLASSARVWTGLAKDTSDHDPVSVQLQIKIDSGKVPSKLWRSEP